MSSYASLDRPPLDAVALRRALLGRGRLWREVLVEEALPSTNSTLAELASSGAPEGVVLVTEHQTAGRGRLERAWVVPPRAALTFSVLLRPDEVPGRRWPWLPLLTGVAIAEALRRTALVEAELKWPNDVLVGDRKVAGILLERLDTPAGPAAVVGIGLNVSTRRDELPGATATSLMLEEASVTDRSVLLRAVLRMLAALYGDWRRSGGDPARGLGDAYRALCSTLGQRVRMQIPSGSPVEGMAIGIDDDGRLLVDVGGAPRAYSAGDVTHVRRA